MEYYIDHRVTTSDLDMWGHMRVPNILTLFQEVSGLHTAAFGISSPEVAKAGASWIIANTWLRLSRPLREGDRLRVVTYQRPRKGVRFVRDYEILDCDGTLLGEGISDWILADLETHELLMPNAVRALIPEAASGGTKILKMPKLKAPEGLAPLGTHTFGYSETDINGHVNNTRYVDVVCDVLHFERRGGKFLRELLIGYRSECLAGEEVALEGTGGPEGGFVRGVADGKVRFETEVKYGDTGEE